MRNATIVGWCAAGVVGLLFAASCGDNASNVLPLPSTGGSAGTGASAPGGAGGSGLNIGLTGGSGGQGATTGGGGQGGGPAPACGDGTLDLGEHCDDGNGQSGDGCDANCNIEDGFACPTPGQPCITTVVCGDGFITGDETCDDSNAVPGDGCNAQCQIELGWSCPVAGAACVATACGDGYLAGFEQCDDGNSNPNDGCDPTCHLEPGYKCPVPGQPCVPTVCGDGAVEGTEQCEDGNLDVGDGCDPYCMREPQCSNGACAAVCGDGVVWPPEECDDGNLMNGDGCSSSCKVELGFGCTEVAQAPPAQVLLPVTIRDFIAACGAGARLTDADAGAVAPYGHPDFECFLTGLVTGMVQNDLSAAGKPVWNANTATHDANSFALWYVDNQSYNRVYAQHLTLPSIGGGAYQFASAAFFPVDGIGFVGEGYEIAHNGGHNFSFTSETHYWFQYAGNEVLDFTGDDDVWVFINRHLAVDIGGVHGATNGSVDLSNAGVAAALGLTIGGIYEAVVFQAERHTTASNYRLTLTNFTHAPSVCTSTCGDGVKAADEACDDGVNDGSYGHCTADCHWGPRCGDGVLQSQFEDCDDGLNVTSYQQGSPGCAPGCKWGHYCGDGIVDSIFGEACDDGVNSGGYGKCAPGCVLGPRCGDGIVQTDAGEQCDDGNKHNGDGCDANCQLDVPR